MPNSPPDKPDTVLSEKSIHELIAEHVELSEQYKTLIAPVNALKTQLENLEERLVFLMTNPDAPTALMQTNRGTAKLKTSRYPRITDVLAFGEYVKATDAFYLFQRRLSQAPFNELLDAGEEIPGTEVYEKVSVSVTPS